MTPEDDLGLVAYGQGDYGAARSLHEESLVIGRELGNRWGIAASLNSLGGLAAYQQGEYGAARSLYEESVAIRRELGDRSGIVQSLETLAELACEGPPGAGDVAGSDRGPHSTPSSRRMGCSTGGGGSVPTEEAAVIAGAGRRAGRLFGAAEALREATGAPLPPGEQETYRRQVSRVRELLEEEAFAAAWAEGRAMAPDEAIAYALREAGDSRK